MDEHIDNAEAQPGRRTFVLTPAGDKRLRRASKSRRTLLIGGTLAIPFLSSIAGEPAMAYWKKKKKKKGWGGKGKKKKHVSGGISYHPSITGKKKKKSKKKWGGKKKYKRWGELEHGGQTVAMWREKYPQLLAANTTEAAAFPAKATAQRYLSNPVLASVFVVPRDTVNGVAIAPPSGTIETALNGAGTWSVSLTHNGATAHKKMDGAFFAEASAAVLNGARHGENGFGMTDKMVIEQVASALRNLQGRADALRRAHPDWEAARLLDSVSRHITGGSILDPRGETYYLAQLNSGGAAA